MGRHRTPHTTPFTALIAKQVCSPAVAQTLGSGQVFLTAERSDCHKRSQAKHPQRGGGHSHDNRRRRI